MSNAAWTDKYAPQTTSEILGNTLAIKKLKTFLLNWPNTKKRGLLLIGKSGIGKTSSVYAFAKEHGYSVTEFNASDTRNKSAISEKIKVAATTQRLFGTGKRLILVDEVDGLHGRKERGAAGALAKVLKIAKHPMVFTANEYNNNIRTLKRYCEVLYFKRIRDPVIIRAMKNILEEEQVESEDLVLKALAKISEGDVRAAINNLQQLAKGKKALDRSLIQELKARDSVMAAIDAVPKIMAARNPVRATDFTFNLDVDYREFLMWMYDHAYKWAKTPDDLVTMYDSISKADRYLTRIIFTQNWKLLRYFYLHLSAGLNIASTKSSAIRINKYYFPTTWKKMGKLKSLRNKRKALLILLQRETHTSRAKNTKYTLPYLKFIFKNNPKMAAQILYDHNIPQGVCKSILKVGKRKYDGTKRKICGYKYPIGEKVPSKCKVCGKSVIFVLEPLVTKREFNKIKKEYLKIKQIDLEKKKRLFKQKIEQHSTPSKTQSPPQQPTKASESKTKKEKTTVQQVKKGRKQKKGQTKTTDDEDEPKDKENKKKKEKTPKGLQTFFQ